MSSKARVAVGGISSMGLWICSGDLQKEIVLVQMGLYIEPQVGISV